MAVVAVRYNLHPRTVERWRARQRSLISSRIPFPVDRAHSAPNSKRIWWLRATNTTTKRSCSPPNGSPGRTTSMCRGKRLAACCCVLGVREKKTLTASERDETKRRAWRDEVQLQAADDFVFVDESSTHLSMTPLYARTKRGTRAYGTAPRGTEEQRP